MDCMDHDVLSAYVDAEATFLELVRVRFHLYHCSRCRESVRVMTKMKERLRRQGVPPMPAELRRSLEEMVPEPKRVERPLYRSPALGFSLACCAVLALILWQRKGADFDEVPLDMILAAHHQYSLTLPLAETGNILAVLPGEMPDSEDKEAPRGL